MRWGDKIPFEFAVEVPAVGNASNAAVAAARLGLNSGLRAYVGDDENGAKCIASLERDGVVTTLVEKQAGKITNYHFVLWYEGERTILIKHEEFDYTVPGLDTAPQWLYLSSLAQNSLPYEEAIVALLAQHLEAKLAFQPGTFQIQAGYEALKNIYERSDIFFCNVEEAGNILGNTTPADKKELLRAVQALGPKIAVVTDGTKGAYAISQSGQCFFIPMYPQGEPFERTGAGDAFASSVVAALALGKPLEEALLWGPVNAMAVVQEIGAQKGLLSRERLEEYIKNAPAEYKITIL